ncbi:MAG: hypothetical protein R3E12_13665 [Candidatus Eisenbacteria bacterium]
MSEDMGFDLPDSFAEEHARRWLDELDRHSVGRAVFFASLPQEIPDVLTLVGMAPDRIAAYSALRPNRPDQEPWLDELLNRGVRGFLLFPAAHHYEVDDRRFDPLWNRSRPGRGSSWSIAGS